MFRASLNASAYPSTPTAYNDTWIHLSDVSMSLPHHDLDPQSILIWIYLLCVKNRDCYRITQHLIPGVFENTTMKWLISNELEDLLRLRSSEKTERELANSAWS